MSNKKKASKTKAVTQPNSQKPAPRPKKVTLAMPVDIIKRFEERAKANGQTFDEAIERVVQADLKHTAIEKWLSSAPKGWKKSDEIKLTCDLTFPGWMWLCIATTAAAHGHTLAQAVEQIVDDGFDAGVHGDDEYPQEHRDNLRQQAKKGGAR